MEHGVVYRYVSLPPVLDFLIMSSRCSRKISPILICCNICHYMMHQREAFFLIIIIKRSGPQAGQFRSQCLLQQSNTVLMDDVFGRIWFTVVLFSLVLSVPGRDIVSRCLSRCVSCPNCRHHATPCNQSWKFWNSASMVFK